ncbi:MAG: DGQHR domain-containing protein [Bacillota bacterium]|nr:MAG: DGQHR domain-containing protein [Bacillota bacterium]
MKVRLMQVEQPIGSFFMAVLPAEYLVSKCTISQRDYNPVDGETFGGPQRYLSDKRIKEIREYSVLPDAVFPTPIVLSVESSEGHYWEHGEEAFFEIADNVMLGEVIDGQHRLAGLSGSSELKSFKLPVVIMFDLTAEEKAYVFSTINSTQVKVNQSLIYDLFALSQTRSPQKTCHEIARLFNTSPDSPFYRRLKMLGKKQEELASLSQASFIKPLMHLISANSAEDLSIIKGQGLEALRPDSNKPLRGYFLRDQDEMIYKILLNLFTAVRDTFPTEWDNPKDYILTKTVGYTAIITAFPVLLVWGRKEKDLTYQFFKSAYGDLKRHLRRQNLELTSDYFKSSQHEAMRLANVILDGTGARVGGADK